MMHQTLELEQLRMLLRKRSSVLQLCQWLSAGGYNELHLKTLPMHNDLAAMYSVASSWACSASSSVQMEGPEPTVSPPAVEDHPSLVVDMNSTYGVNTAVGVDQSSNNCDEQKVAVFHSVDILKPTLALCDNQARIQHHQVLALCRLPRHFGIICSLRSHAAIPRPAHHAIFKAYHECMRD